LEISTLHLTVFWLGRIKSRPLTIHGPCSACESRNCRFPRRAPGSQVRGTPVTRPARACEGSLCAHCTLGAISQVHPPDLGAILLGAHPGARRKRTLGTILSVYVQESRGAPPSPLFRAHQNLWCPFVFLCFFCSFFVFCVLLGFVSVAVCLQSTSKSLNDHLAFATVLGVQQLLTGKY